MTLYEPQVLARLESPFFSQLVARIRAVDRERPGGVVDLARGNPEIPPPSHVIDALVAAARVPEVHGYPAFAGSQTLREAFAAHHRETFGVALDADTEVIAVPGTKTGIALVCMALAGPGEVVLVPDPGYADYPPGVAVSGGRIEWLPLDASDGWAPSWDAVPQRALDDARMAFLNYPSNPTGSIAHDSLFPTAIDVARRNNFAIVHDLAYGELAFEQRDTPRSFLATPGAKDVGVELVSMSKTWCMAGWRLGFVCGNAAIVARVRSLLDALSVGVFDAVQRGATAALTGPQDSVAVMRETYHRRAQRVAQVLGVEASRGGYYTWVKLPDGLTAEALLVEHGVAVAPGDGCGPHGAGWARISVSRPDDVIDAGLERLARAWH